MEKAHKLSHDGPGAAVSQLLFSGSQLGTPHRPVALACCSFGIFSTVPPLHHPALSSLPPMPKPFVQREVLIGALTKKTKNTEAKPSSRKKGVLLHLILACYLREKEKRTYLHLD